MQMNDALKRSRAALDDDGSEELLSPRCRAIVNGEDQHVRKIKIPNEDFDPSALQARVEKLEAAAKRKLSRKMSKADMTLMAEAIGNVLGEATEPLHKRIEKLEGEEKRSRSCAAPVWRGTWHAGMDVEPGSFVTDKGSLWVAVEQSNGTRPGELSCFKLVVKNGHADGRRHVATAIRQ